MSLSSAINAAVTGLNAQSAALATISNNLANSSTIGYKASDSSFSNLVAGASLIGAAAGGVTFSTVANVSSQGLLTSSSSSTSIALEGNGFFPVSTSQDGTSQYYTRDGEFTVDADGYLSNNGYYLLGWKTDASGNVIGGQTSSTLTAMDVDSVASTASPTTSASFVANLPADAAVNDTFTSSMGIYDSLGTPATVDITWTKTGDNTWTASFADPVSSSGATVGTVSSGDITVTFNSDGTFASSSGSTLGITGWTTGAANSSIAINMGTAGSASGLSQYATGSDDQTVALQVTQDGVAKGSLTGIKIGDDGIVSGVYDNGMTRALYKIPVATFANPDGLSAMSGGIYQATAQSGTSTLHASGTGGAGIIHGSELELSTTDTNEEFSKMMAAQQAYSSAAQVVTTAKSMFDTLISAIR